MSQSLKDKLIQSLIDQKEIFGDDLLEEKILKGRRTAIKKKTDENVENLFEEKRTGSLQIILKK